jgi:CheY-like chemotaxis protein
VSLPLQREAGRAETASGAGLGLAEASLLAGVRVLVVDDETDGREMVGAILHHCGAEARLAGSVPEALAAIAERVPDVVITDIEMPGEDGHTLLKRVRALAPERGGRVPVAALTAYASPEDRRKVLAAGFQRHIAKPFQPGDLVAVIARLVGVSPQVP